MKERTLGIRLGDQTSLVDEFEAATGLSAGTIAKELLFSAIKSWQAEGELKWPMVAVPKKEYETLSGRAPIAAPRLAHNLNDEGGGKHPRHQAPVRFKGARKAAG